VILPFFFYRRIEMIISQTTFAFYEWLIEYKGFSTAEDFERLVNEEPETFEKLVQEFEVSYENAIRIKVDKK